MFYIGSLSIFRLNFHTVVYVANVDYFQIFLNGYELSALL